MKFSLLIPTKNRPRMLHTAVKHILNQSYPDFEAIIVDDSGEENGEMVEISTKDARIKYLWRHGSGIGSAMNVGLRNSTGDVFNWHNDDDYIAKRTLEFLSNNIRSAQWCYGRIVILNQYRIPVGLMGAPFDYERLKRQTIIPQPAVFWTRSAFDSLGYFEESIDHVTDYEYWLRLGSKFEPAVFRRFFAYYIVHEHQGSKVFHDLQGIQWEEVKRKYRDVTPDFLLGRK